MQQITLPPNFASGAQIVNIPDTNIMQVTIQTLSAGTWDFLIDNITFVATGPSLIDPVATPNILNGPMVSTDPNVLANNNATVQGVAADGVTETVLKIPASKVGETFTVSVINDQGNVSTSTDDDGGLADVGSECVREDALSARWKPVPELVAAP